MNAFASYGETAVSRRQPEAKPASALDLKMAEKQRLTNAYRTSLRKERTEVLEAEPRLRDFLRYLRSVKPDQGDELLEAVASSWLATSMQPVRIFALRLIDRHANRLARQAGREALDDPLPPETTVYFEARSLLHPGGKL